MMLGLSLVRVGKFWISLSISGATQNVHHRRLGDLTLRSGPQLSQIHLRRGFIDSASLGFAVVSPSPAAVVCPLSLSVGISY